MLNFLFSKYFLFFCGFNVNFVLKWYVTGRVVAVFMLFRLSHVAEC